VSPPAKSAGKLVAEVWMSRVQLTLLSSRLASPIDRAALATALNTRCSMCAPLTA
jgi:hypothetical protein